MTADKTPQQLYREQWEKQKSQKAEGPPGDGPSTEQKHNPEGLAEQPQSSNGGGAGQDDGYHKNGRVYQAESPEEQKRLWGGRLVLICDQILALDPDFHKAHLTFDMVRDALAEEMFVRIKSAETNYTYAALTPPLWMEDDEIRREVDLIIEASWQQFKKTQRNDLILRNGDQLANLPDTKVRALTIVEEDAEQAVESNAEYLSRSALIERLYYTHHASLNVGGKHEGKTTALKTEAISLASGVSMIYGRQTVQTPVIYAASEDEYPSVRMDLLRMGWNPAIPLKMVRIAENADRDFVLEDIAKLALKMGAYFVVLDMLFDFTQIQDELKYAHTREATGKVIQLAVAISGHVRASHHSPKWMPDAATAAKAALGSQGIAARFSPIVLSRMWVEPQDERPGLYTIESTMTRDPRGLALPRTLVTKNQQGWAIATEAFKQSMQWPIYAQRILDFFEMGEPDARYTVATVARELEIPRQHTQNAMMRLAQGPDAKLERVRKMIGRGGPYSYALIRHNSLTQVYERLKDADTSQDSEHVTVYSNSDNIRNSASRSDKGLSCPFDGHFCSDEGCDEDFKGCRELRTRSAAQ